MQNRSNYYLPLCCFSPRVFRRAPLGCVIVVHGLALILLTLTAHSDSIADERGVDTGGAETGLTDTGLTDTGLIDEGGNLLVEPKQTTLLGTLDRLQLLVTQVTADERLLDRTRQADYEVLTPRVLAVDHAGRVTPLDEGDGRVRIKLGLASTEVSVKVALNTPRAAASFVDDVMPALSKAGCNQGRCHASQFGKGGFKLSVFGFDSSADYQSLVRQWNQRRISPVRPRDSLVLKKATMQVAHGGGKRFAQNSYLYEILRSWIAEGAREGVDELRELAELAVMPAIRTYNVGQQQQLRVVARYRDGTVRDVTRLATYDSLDEGVTTVQADGRLTAAGNGQAGVMVRFRGQAQVSRVVTPYADSVDLANFAAVNFIDDKVKEGWQRLGVRPSNSCTDAEFVRRAFVDCLGTLPKPEKVKAFLASPDPHRRTELIDELLGLTGDAERDIYEKEFSAYWTLKFGDMLRNNRKTAGDSGMWALHNWLKKSLRENKPLDQITRELVTAQGSIFEDGPVNYIAYSPRPTDPAQVAPPTDLAETTAQVFLGIRLQCARCHHHPFDVYSQADYYGLAAFFTRLQSKSSDGFGQLGFDAVVSLKPTGSIRHPRSGAVVPPKPLLAKPIDTAGVEDLRESLVDWLLSSEDRLFARNMANRIWGLFLGTGIVEPVDDVRSTNPPSNPELLDALARDLIANKYDLRLLMRRIMRSRVYQLGATPRPENLDSTRFYTHYNIKRLPAEVLLDAINFACGTREDFEGVPRGTRAIELPDPNFESYFLDTLGRPQRLTNCECERTAEPNMAQVLHLANGDLLQKKLTDKSGRIERLVESGVDEEEAIGELYLVAFARPPLAEEITYCCTLIERSATQREGLENILWALCNSREFLLNH